MFLIFSYERVISYKRKTNRGEWSVEAMKNVVDVEIEGKMGGTLAAKTFIDYWFHGICIWNFVYISITYGVSNKIKQKTNHTGITIPILNTASILTPEPNCSSVRQRLVKVAVKSLQKTSEVCKTWRYCSCAGVKDEDEEILFTCEFKFKFQSSKKSFN